LKKVLLVILDGWGLSPLQEGNSTYLANTPNLDWIYGSYPKTSLSASGVDVGVSSGESGNSEVGHLNIGSGRVVWESLPRINQSIDDGSFFQNDNILSAINNVKNSEKALHLVGLCSAGSVHSNINHLFALLKIAGSQRLDKVYIHMITDGRDTAQKVAKEDIAKIKEQTEKNGVGKIATIIGRFYAMDRDKHYERIEKAYNLWVSGSGDFYNDPLDAIEANYRAGADDEKIGPCLLDKDGLIKQGDSIVMFNFRADRARQMLETFESDSFFEFNRQKISNLNIVTMTKYFDSQKSSVIFLPLNMESVLADVVASAGLKQSHIAETEKYAHVTYFFNGGEEKPHENENQILVPSKGAESYDTTPEMSASEIKEKVLEALDQQNDFVVVNFANGDMVGHSGNLEATVKAVEAVDLNLAEIMSRASKNKYSVIITADHGNCELMVNPANGEINKEHTSSPVPFVFADLAIKPFTPQSGIIFSKQNLIDYSAQTAVGVLADIAPTIIELLGVAKPPEMSGRSLLNLI